METRLKIAWYAERSSLADINPKSYYFIAFEPVNPLLYIYFPSFEFGFFFQRSEVYVAIVTSLIIAQIPANYCQKRVEKRTFVI